MSKPQAKPGFPHSPEHTYLNERLQSARWLGWHSSGPAQPSRRTSTARAFFARLVTALGLTPARANRKPT